MQETLARRTIQQVAIDLLARRDHSRFELQQKLRQRGFVPEQITDLLQTLAEQGLQSDRCFADNYCRARMNKGYGPLRIAAELQQRGIVQELIEQCLSAVETNWLQQAICVQRKRFGKKIPVDFHERARQMRFLQYRGFSSEHIHGIFSMIDDSD